MMHSSTSLALMATAGAVPVSGSRRVVVPAAARASGSLWRLLSLMLDEIDYGMLLVAEDATVLHANQAARLELADEHPLQFVDASLQPRRAADLPALREAIADAIGRGLRRLLSLGEGAREASIAVVPLPAAGGDGPAAALLVLGKRHVCEELSVHGFARGHGLTPAETEVLKGLCRGARPAEIAAAQGVRLSTVRTQIGSIRSKTGAESIRALVRQVAVLPPMVNALRSAGSRAAARAAPAGALR